MSLQSKGRLLPISNLVPPNRSSANRFAPPFRRLSWSQYQPLRSSWRRQSRTGYQRIVYQNSVSWAAAIAVIVATGASIGFAAGFSRAFYHPVNTESPIPIPSASKESVLGMTTSMPPGRPGTLTLEEEAKLRELWQLALQVFGVADAPTQHPQSLKGKSPVLSRTSTSAQSKSPPASEKKKKSRLSFLKTTKKDEDEYYSDTPTGSISGTSTPSSGKSRISRVWGCGLQY